MRTGTSMVICHRRHRKKTPIADMRRMVAKRTDFDPVLIPTLSREQCENLLTQAFAAKRARETRSSGPGVEAVPTGCVPGKVA